ncbi:hypothetical protein ACQQ2Q_17935 [Agrobacterium sp. ES01]|uniref:hypothetical protein n=1 Tax=Agrobacterium sp. ES01 TaxID=3420714 RepID=UPI003D0EF7BD
MSFYERLRINGLERFDVVGLLKKSVFGLKVSTFGKHRVTFAPQKVGFGYE